MLFLKNVPIGYILGAFWVLFFMKMYQKCTIWVHFVHSSKNTLKLEFSVSSRVHLIVKHMTHDCHHELKPSWLQFHCKQWSPKRLTDWLGRDIEMDPEESLVNGLPALPPLPDYEETQRDDEIDELKCAEEEQEEINDDRDVRRRRTRGKSKVEKTKGKSKVEKTKGKQLALVVVDKKKPKNMEIEKIEKPKPEKKKNPRKRPASRIESSNNDDEGDDQDASPGDAAIVTAGSVVTLTFPHFGFCQGMGPRILSGLGGGQRIV